MQMFLFHYPQILTKSVLCVCPNQKCEMSRSQLSFMKDGEDCNTVECTKCARFFCFICSKDLGEDKWLAHSKFPHENESSAHAPPCWLFNENETGNTEEKALHLRKLHGVTMFLSALRISKIKKEVYLDECQDLLGELYHDVREVPKESPDKSKKTCTIS